MKVIKKNKKTIVIVLSIVAMVLVIASAVYFIFFNKPATTFPGTAGVSEVNYDPPTDEEKQSGNDQKEAVVEQDKLDTQGTTNTQADVFISDASYYSDSGVVEVRGYITNIYEDGGQCTATLTQGTHSVSQTSTGFKDATTTQCGAINIPRSKFPAGGTWNLTLTYNSTTAKGSSAANVQL